MNTRCLSVALLSRSFSRPRLVLMSTSADRATQLGLSQEELRLFRIYQTTISMLEKRGYAIGKKERTLEDFAVGAPAQCGSPGSPNIEDRACGALWNAAAVLRLVIDRCAWLHVHMRSRDPWEDRKWPKTTTACHCARRCS
jgi:hypothetical protein